MDVPFRALGTYPSTPPEAAIRCPGTGPVIDAAPEPRYTSFRAARPRGRRAPFGP